MSNSKTICLCLIVKNEEKTLPRLIESCEAIIDYWVIINTGSTDKTKEVVDRELKGIKGEYYEKEWKNFGHNRTELVKLAKGKADYLLLMDADMVVRTDKTFDKSRLNADMYMIRYTGEIDYAQPLLVSGHINWYYEGYTHEYITSKDKFNRGVLSGLMIGHHADGGTRHEKLERDIKLLQTEIIDYPQRARPHFYLAQTHMLNNNFNEAIESYKNRIKLGGWQQEIYYSLYQIGMALYSMGDKPSAILQMMEAYNVRPIRFEALFMLGQIHREQKKYSIARIFLERVLKQPYPKDDILFIHRVHYDYLADFELGICNYWLGNYKEAEKHCRKLMNRDGIDPQIAKQNLMNFEFIRAKLNLKKNNKNDIIYVSMYTHATAYQEEAEKLKASLVKFNLKYEVAGIRPQGSWVKNTQQKPVIILEIMERENQDVVWVDADAEILEYPKWFDSITCDLAYHTIASRNEMLTGTVYFANNDKVKDFLNRWDKLNKTNNIPDAVNFQSLLTGDQHLIKLDMPAAYVRIFDSPEMEGIEPVIVHNQASRRLKQSVNTGVSPDNLTYTLLKHLKGEMDSCSVIGNGPFSSDLAAEIDKTFVMRCNNFRIGDGFESIGTRIDLNISSMYQEIVPNGHVDYPIFAILPISNSLYQRFTDAKQMHQHWQSNANACMNNGNVVWTYTDKDDYANLFSEVANKINAFPTVGILGIATAREIGFKKIILSGFTFFQTDKSHYWSDIKVRPSLHHDPEAERELIEHWIDNDDIEYILDDMMKQNIYIDETVERDTVK